MNVRDIEYFVAVADLGAFGRAADRCCVSQPTLSGQIRKLEDELGHPLFERSTRSVILTPFGMEVLEIARSVLDGCDEIIKRGRALDDPFSGDLSLGLFPTLCPWLLPRLAPLFSATYSAIDFTLVEEKTAVLQRMLAEHRLDGAILALPQETEDVVCLPLFSEPFLAAVHPSHPWSKRVSVHPSELAGQPLLLLEDGHCLRDQSLDLCARYGVGEHGTFRATSLETLRQMVRLGSGITLIPRLAVNESIDDGVRYIPFETTDARRDIGLCYRRSHPRARLFVDIARRIGDMCGIALPVDRCAAQK